MMTGSSPPGDAAPPSTGAPGASARWLLDRLLAGEDDRLARWTRRQLDARPAWAAYYSAQREAERRAADAVLGAAQRDSLLASIAGALPDAAAAPDAAAETGRGRAWWWPAGGLATATAAAALLVVVWPTSPDPQPVQLTPRGQIAPLGVKLMCVDVDAGRVLGSAEGAARGAVVYRSRLECPHEEALWISATNGETAPRHLFVVAANAAGEARWLAPFGSDAGSQLLAAGTYDHRLDALARLNDLPVDEELAVFALFSEQPIEPDAVRSALRLAKNAGLKATALKALPNREWKQARLTLEVLSASARTDGGRR